MQHWSSSQEKDACIIVVMGVAGCGKSTVASELAKRLNWPCYDADDFHSLENISKMSSGTPLTDEDRMPWLQFINSHMLRKVREKQNSVYACSALKETYRQILNGGMENIHFVFLNASYTVLSERLKHRNHFMKADMLQSQLDILEKPRDAITINCEKNVFLIVDEIIEALDKQDVYRD